MPLANGAVFAGYTIVAMLGAGGMGEVYLAQHPRLPRRDALKVLSTAVTADSEYRERFRREADTAATLYHPHIVEVHDRGEFDGQLWIAMDYVNGTNAAQLVADRYPAGMPAGEVLAIIAAIAAALDYAHQRGLLHRDVKPANILLTKPEDGEQRILLADFGIARQVGDPAGLTATNLTVGTVAYAAPEQLMGADIDGRADQYALAATAFHLLTGAPPFQHANPAAVIGQHLSAAPPKLSDRRADLARLDDVLATALAKDPSDRFARCRAFAEALGRVWIDNRCSEAFGSAVEYPSDGLPDTQLALRKFAPQAGEAAPTGATPLWETAAARPLAAGRSRTPSSSTEPVTGSRSRARAPTRRRWIVLGSATGAGLLVLIGLLVGFIVVRKSPAPLPRSAAPATGSHASAPAAAPTTRVPALAPADQRLNGSYRMDVDRAHQTYNDTPDPQPPNVATWWAFRTLCTPAGCVATGTMLDANGHQKSNTTGGGGAIILDFREGAWQSRPQTVQFPCVGPNGTAHTETTTQQVSLQPHGPGLLRGVMTVTVQSNECGQQGGEIAIPAVAARVGDMPSEVTAPNPPTTSSPAPTTAPIPSR